MNVGTAVTVRSRGSGYIGNGHNHAAAIFEAVDPVNPACCFVTLTAPWDNIPTGTRIHVHLKQAIARSEARP